MVTVVKQNSKIENGTKYVCDADEAVLEVFVFFFFFVFLYFHRAKMMKGEND